ncbi:hypothetical protein BS47DRAFT_1373678 [Hydnum rufescens UP504]|uniref:GAMM1 protein n=1 Tax=Hydnum rufescens UP504 TaxID=1448309 RepID=A0A9P6AMB1_9AGAM|nr:hypothetical protein BS47DRAFT_1373678 [Hydnum rufescens UP504]
MSSEQPVTKRLKTSSDNLVIGTHNGTFHCDEALAVFLLHQTPKYKDANLVRTRDPPRLEQCDIVVDVGAVYNPVSLRFDHHQRGFTETFGHGFETKLSSAGLIYKHFGREIISERLNISPQDPTVEKLYLKLYKEFIEAIDGVDNGINQYPKDITPKYKNSTHLSSRVSHLNPAWNESVDAAGVDARFKKASELAGTEFLDRLDYYAKAWLPGRGLVEEAIKGPGKIILFEQFAPWKEHLFDIESELSIPEDDKPYYVLYADETGGSWRVQAIPVSPESFESRKPLPEAIPGGVFVHASGFIGGNKTREGALELAIKALTLP